MRKGGRCLSNETTMASQPPRLSLIIIIIIIIKRPQRWCGIRVVRSLQQYQSNIPGDIHFEYPFSS